MHRPLAPLLLLASTLTCCQSQPPEPPPLEWPERPPPQPAQPAAQTPKVEALDKSEWTLDDALAVAEALNPDLAVERRNVDLATAAIWEARLYPNPELQLQVEDWRTQDGLTLSHAKRWAGIGIPLVVSGRIGAATSAAEAGRDAAAVLYVWRRRTLLSRVKLAFVELLAARKNLELASETRDIARSFRDATDQRFQAQAIPEMELLKAAVNLARAESEVSLAQKRLAVAERSLAASIGRPGLVLPKIAGELPTGFAAPDFPSLREQVVANHPLLEEAVRNREAADRDLELARTERIPDLGVELAAGKDPQDENIVQAGITLPLGLFNRNQAKIESASIRLEQAQSRIASARNDLELSFDERARSFVAAAERATSFEHEILPKAQRALDQTSEGYRLGKFAFLDVLDAQRTLAEAKRDYAESVALLNFAATDLETLTGTAIAPLPALPSPPH
jgi:cobalt-zinc-cadmium efflux system outer membrane protein